MRTKQSVYNRTLVRNCILNHCLCKQKLIQGWERDIVHFSTRKK